MSISANKIKIIKSLDYPKYRKQHGLFVVEGEKMANELLQSGFEIDSIYATNEWKTGTDNKLDVTVISDNELKKISGFKAPNNVLALAKIPEYKEFTLDINNKELILLLDRIQDPGNLGTIIRTADWFGVKNIICSRDSVDVYNAKVVQATMGSIFRVKVTYEDLELTIEKLKQKVDIEIFGATMSGRNIYETDISLPAVLVLGNESQGISKELLNSLDSEISIPLFKMDNAPESLNVGVASSILCSEIMRKNFYV